MTRAETVATVAPLQTTRKALSRKGFALQRFTKRPFPNGFRTTYSESNPALAAPSTMHAARRYHDHGMRASVITETRLVPTLIDAAR